MMQRFITLLLLWCLAVPCYAADDLVLFDFEGPDYGQW